MYKFNILLGLLAISKATPFPRQPTCVDLKVPLQATATNLALPTNFNYNGLFRDPAKAGSSLPSPTPAEVGGNFTLNVRFCEPAREVASRKSSLQILVHGSTYTRNYWSGLAEPGTRPGQDKYSWVYYASNEGFPTLSVDVLCSGLSTRANPITECQIPLEQETLNVLINIARTAGLPAPANRAFGKIIYTGHSFGSMLGNALAAAHPFAADAYVLTGFSGNISNGAVGALTFPGYAPATAADPVRFFGLNPSYLAASNPKGVRRIFYDGDFDSLVSTFDYSTRGTLTIGEVLTNSFGQVQAPSYTGPLFTLNGNEDEIFCETGPQAQLAGDHGNCSASFSADVQKLYPAASSFAFYNTPKTGHCLNLHDSAQDSFRAAHEFLRNVGF